MFHSSGMNAALVVKRPKRSLHPLGFQRRHSPSRQTGQPRNSSTPAFIWADPATTCGLPATAVPVEWSPSDLPIGVQIIGPYLEDRTTITFAALLERKFGGFVPPDIR
jgi:Asp-tRNA(Asn)/Glu-tRNA(Gln) amidotransferase A subunit family amidase